MPQRPCHYGARLVGTRFSFRREISRQFLAWAMPAVMIGQGGPGNSIKPGLDLLAVPQRGARAVHLHQCVLGNVVRRRVVANAPADERPQLDCHVRHRPIEAQALRLNAGRCATSCDHHTGLYAVISALTTESPAVSSSVHWAIIARDDSRNVTSMRVNPA